MKNTKTTMKELSAMYRSVLLKCFAAAMALTLATSASAAVTLQDVIDNAKTGEVAEPDISTYKYDAQGDGDASNDIAITDGVDTVNNADYSFTDTLGNTKDASSSVSASEYVVTNQSGGAAYDASSTVVAGDYTYENHDGSDVSLSDADKTATELSTTGYDVTYDTTYRKADAGTNVSAGEPTASQYSYTDADGNSHTLEVNADESLRIPLEIQSDAIALANAGAAIEAFGNDKAAYALEKAAYDADNTAYLAAIEKLNTDTQNVADAKANFDADTTSLAGVVANRDAAQASLTAVSGQYTTDKTAYDVYGDSLSNVIDDKAETKANAAVAVEKGEREAADTALNNKIDGVVQQAQDAFAEKQQWVDDTLGITSADTNAVKNEYTGTTYLTDATTFTGADKALDTAIKTNAEAIADNKTAIETNAANIATNAEGIEANKTAIATLNGDDTVEGSVKHTVKNNAENAVYTGVTVATKAKAGSEQTLGSALSATTTQVNTNTTAIDQNTQNIAANTTAIQKNATDIGSLQTAFSDTKRTYDARFASLDNKIDDLEDDMKAGLASNAALASLVPMSSEHKTQISMGMGGYKDKQGLALGAFHYATDNILLNAGAAYGGSDSYSYKAGVTFGF